MTATCAVCGRDIQRVFVGSVEGWGHTTNVQDHHYAKPQLQTRAEPASSRQPQGDASGAASFGARGEPDHGLSSPLA